MKATVQDIQNIIRNASGGTDSYYKYGLFFPSVITQGVRDVCEKAGAYWLLDVILSYQGVRAVKECDLQFWRLEVYADRSARVFCDRDEGDTIISQDISYTDFPQMTFKIWFSTGERVIYLPCEH